MGFKRKPRKHQRMKLKGRKKLETNIMKKGNLVELDEFIDQLSRKLRLEILETLNPSEVSTIPVRAPQGQGRSRWKEWTLCALWGFAVLLLCLLSVCYKGTAWCCDYLAAELRKERAKT